MRTRSFTQAIIIKPLHNKTDKYELYQLLNNDADFLASGRYLPGEILIFNRGLRHPQPGQEIGKADTLSTARNYIDRLTINGEGLPLDSSCRYNHSNSDYGDDNADGDNAGGDNAGAGNNSCNNNGSSNNDVNSTIDANTNNNSDSASKTNSNGSNLLASKDKHFSELELKYAKLQKKNKELTRKNRDIQARVEKLSAETLTADQINNSLLEDLASAGENQNELSQELDELRSETARLRRENSQMIVDSAEIISQRDALQNSVNNRTDSQGNSRDGSSKVSSQGNSRDASSKVSSQGNSRDGSSKVDNSQIDASPKEDILLMPDGGTIHIYHEFPSAPRLSRLRRLMLYLSNAWIRYVIVIIVSLYLLWSIAMFVSLANDGIDISVYADKLWQSLLGQ
ncbi:hypothetical protein FACS1894185_4000 [Betaproteobacteria bacterium]|nr:hypothetical protein FACS1894185_4000 [Betaproteobacteria bacterium]